MTPRVLLPIAHGTIRGYRMELRRNGESCPACREAVRIYQVPRNRVNRVRVQQESSRS